MSTKEQALTTFQTRVRDLLLRFQTLKQENEQLSAQVERNERDLARLQTQMAQKENDYNTLKMAKMVEITSGDLEASKARLAKLIRDVNKCIAIFSDEQ